MPALGRVKFPQSLNSAYTEGEVEDILMHIRKCVGTRVCAVGGKSGMRKVALQAWLVGAELGCSLSIVVEL